MSKLLAVAVILALGAVVYAKVIRPSPEVRVCERLSELCGAKVEADECSKELDQAAKALGDEYFTKAADCIGDATSCFEAAGCMVGAGDHLLDDFKRGIERARR